MKKRLYGELKDGAKYIYISRGGAWVEGIWRTKGDLSESFVPHNRWVWVGE